MIYDGEYIRGLMCLSATPFRVKVMEFIVEFII